MVEIEPDEYSPAAFWAFVEQMLAALDRRWRASELREALPEIRADAEPQLTLYVVLAEQLSAEFLTDDHSLAVCSSASLVSRDAWRFRRSLGIASCERATLYRARGVPAARPTSSDRVFSPRWAAKVSKLAR